jgi:regulator of protease activity HflC (stomatin/prohibitin superfamily)
MRESYYGDSDNNTPAPRKRGLTGKAKGLAIFIAAILLIGIFYLFFVERVPQGYVGVVYSMNGGVQDKVLPQGWHVLGPDKKVTIYSVATEQLVMTKTKKDDDNNDAFDAVCKDGRMNVDIEFTYSFKAEEVPAVFTRYRGMSGEDVVNTVIKNKIKTYASEVTSKYTVMEAYMDKRANVNADLKKTMQEKLKEYGVSVESCSITRADLDPEIEKAIKERSRVAQELETAKQLQEKKKIEAESLVIEAKGKADAAIEAARGEAESNKLRAASITQPLIDMKLAEARVAHGWVTIQGANTYVPAQ